MAEAEPESLSVGQKIREMRLMRGLTQADLAADFVTASMISQVEAGRTRPSNSLLAVIADRLEVPMEYFTGAPLTQIQAGVRSAMVQFWLLVGRPEQAYSVFQTIPEPPAQPALREYQFLKARTLRAVGQTDGAKRILTSLLMDGIRRQDHLQLCHVHKEYGYVEYALTKPASARHEWMKALEIGEGIAYLPEFASIHLHAEMAELCLRLHDVCLVDGDEETAQDALRRAVVWSQADGTLQSMALAAVAGVEQAVEAGEVTLAERTMQEAVTVLTWTNIAVQRLQIESTANPSSDAPDLWDKAAISLATSNPEGFLAAERARITALLQQGDYQRAAERSRRAQSVVDDYRGESPLFADALLVERLQLGHLAAQCEWKLGEHQTAIRHLSELADEARNAKERTHYLETAGLLLQYYVELGDVAHAMASSEALEQYLMAVH